MEKQTPEGEFGGGDSLGRRAEGRPGGGTVALETQASSAGLEAGREVRSDAESLSPGKHCKAAGLGSTGPSSSHRQCFQNLRTPRCSPTPDTQHMTP